MKHFFQTLRNTRIDARHDAVFGLALYAMSLVTGMMRPHSTRPSGRHLLRSLAEANITLAYLVFRDDPEIWKVYRAYGTGQAKLAFLKLVETEREDLPRHVDVALLERLANEDMWQEYVSIDVGHWAGLTARKMADDARVKDVYDKFYVGPSGFVHGQWAAVRDSVFDLCANPLHRFHRVPRPMRVDMPDVYFDAVRLMNRILGLVDQAFPSFALRFDEPSVSVTTDRTDRRPRVNTSEPIAAVHRCARRRHPPVAHRSHPTVGFEQRSTCRNTAAPASVCDRCATESFRFLSWCAKYLI